MKDQYKKNMPTNRTTKNKNDITLLTQSHKDIPIDQCLSMTRYGAALEIGAVCLEDINLHQVANVVTILDMGFYAKSCLLFNSGWSSRSNPR